MKRNHWLGAVLCMAVAGCGAMPPREPASSEVVVPEALDMAAERLPAMSDQSPMAEQQLLSNAPGREAPSTTVTPVVAEPVTPTVAPVAASAAKPVARVAARPAPEPVAARPPAAKAEAKVATRAEAAPSTPVAAPSTVARSLAGRMELVASARQAVAVGEAAEGVVYFLPKGGVAKPRPDRVSVDTHSKGFRPGSVVVPVGSTIAFPNRDEILHNVYSATPGTTFDLGTYGPGQTRSARFGKAGLVLVACNVHHGMRANVLVLETPYFARPDRDGRFELKSLPPGPGTLVFWHPRAVAQSRAITMPAAPVAARLTAVRARIGAN